MVIHNWKILGINYGEFVFCKIFQKWTFYLKNEVRKPKTWGTVLNAYMIVWMVTLDLYANYDIFLVKIVEEKHTN